MRIATSLPAWALPGVPLNRPSAARLDDACDEITPSFAGLELVAPGPVAPGLVAGLQWRPQGAADIFLDEPERCLQCAGVGDKA